MSSDTLSSDDENAPEKDYFPFDPDVTDVVLIVEEKKLHVSKFVLMDASPVFRKMFTDDFKEKGAMELELPGKKYSTFVLFLRCIFPREYVTMTENEIEDILPLAHQYDVRCVLRKCETWLLTELKFKTVKEPSNYAGVNKTVNYFIKCLYYGAVYDLREIYDKVLEALIRYKIERYAENKFYKLLPMQNKIELLESRLSKIEREGRISRDATPFYGSSGCYKCPLDLFV